MSAPAVAVSADGKQFAAAWMDKRSGKDDLNVYWALSASPGPPEGAGPRFAEDARVHEETRGIQNHPAVTIDRSGVAWVAFEDDPEKSGAAVIRIRSSAAGSKDRLLSDPSEGPAGFPALAAGGGLVGVAYEVKVEDGFQVRFRLVEGG